MYYISNYNNSTPQNIYTCWSFVNGMKGSRKAADSYHLNNRTESYPVGICHLFTDQFSSVYTKNAFPLYNLYTSLNLFDSVLSDQRGKKILYINAVPHNIPPIVPKHCSALPVPRFTEIFNGILKFGVF